MTKPKTHTVKLLQEMRERFGDVNTHIDGLTHVVTLMAGYSHDLDERVERLKSVTKSD